MIAPQKEKKYPQRGEIWITNLQNTFGSEQSWIRPCVVLNQKNKKEKTCIIVPASKTIRPQSFTLNNFSFLLNQIRVVDTQRLERKINRFSKNQTDSIGLAVQKIIVPDIKKNP